jgi:hypothetical protein
MNAFKSDLSRAPFLETGKDLQLVNLCIESLRSAKETQMLYAAYLLINFLTFYEAETTALNQALTLAVKAITDQLSSEV